MPRLADLALIATLVALPPLALACAQGEPPPPVAARLTLDEARRAVDAAEAEAKRKGWRLVFVITDAEGGPIYLRRMDGVPTRNYDIAMRKVNTVIQSGMNTLDYGIAVKEGRVSAIENGVTFDGGLLLRRDGQLLGAFSASGASAEDDAKAVRAGMAAVGIAP